MAQHVFRLEQVLRYRRQLEEQAALQCAQAQTARDACRSGIDACVAALSAQRAKLCDPAALGEQERWVIGRYVESLRQDLDAARERLVLLEEALDRCRAELIQRAQDSQLLEKLKTNQASRHRREEALQEQREHDEIATLRFAVPSVQTM